MGEHADDVIDATEWAREQGYSQKKIDRLMDSGDLVPQYWSWQGQYGEHATSCPCQRCTTDREARK